MMKDKGYAPSALRNFIRDVAVPAYILTDNAYEEVLGEWEEICKTYCIPQITSEPHYQHQKKAERRIQDIKKRARLLMQARDAPEKYWDFAVELATEYLNHIATRKLGWKTPYEYHYGDTPDISVFHFLFFEEIYYLEPNASFPKPSMLPGRFLGIARTTGDVFTFYILTKSEKGRDVILTHSVVRKHHQDAPQTYAEYPDQKERAEEMTAVQVD